MDICVVVKDVVIALIGAVIPSFVAWRISKQWQKQKQTEILSAKAEEIYLKLDKAIPLLKIIEMQIDGNPAKALTNNSNYAEFKIKCEDIWEKLSLFNALINEVKPSYLSNFNNFFEELEFFKKDNYEFINLFQEYMGGGGREVVTLVKSGIEEEEKLKILVLKFKRLKMSL